MRIVLYVRGFFDPYGALGSDNQSNISPVDFVAVRYSPVSSTTAAAGWQHRAPISWPREGARIDDRWSFSACCRRFWLSLERSVQCRFLKSDLDYSLSKPSRQTSCRDQNRVRTDIEKYFVRLSRGNEPKHWKIFSTHIFTYSKQNDR